MFTHKQACIDAFLEFEKLQEEWITKWPNHCTTCHAQGFEVVPGDWVPWGSTKAQLPDMSEPCNECTENGRCGRCGVSLFDPEEHDFDSFVVCEYCGWTDNPDKQLQQKDLIHPRLNQHPTGEGPCECEMEAMKMAEEAYFEYRNRVELDSEEEHDSREY